jgi:rhamnosyltransferase
VAETLNSSSPFLPLCAVVVTYHPDDDVVANLGLLVQECSRVLVVDNGSPVAQQTAMALVPGVTLLPQKENIGLAAALNLGLTRALELGCEWAVTFDQDSRPEPGMVQAMWATHRMLPEAKVVGPRIHEEGSVAANYRWVARHKTWPFLFRRLPCTGTDLPEVTMMVTSGSMLDLAEWRRLGAFDAGLFIDYIDTDYCLRVIRAGGKVAVAGQALLRHRLGARASQVFMGREFRPTHHAAFRHYYMARNRVAMWRRHAWAVPHWAAFDLSFALYNYTRVLLFERERWAKLKSILRGTWHGLRGITGPMPT